MAVILNFQLTVWLYYVFLSFIELFELKNGVAIDILFLGVIQVRDWDVHWGAGVILVSLDHSKV